ncbi:MAG TPA: DinB family protein [Terriglobales bacterium]
MRNYFERMFRYDDWANRQVLAALRAAAVLPARPLELIAHVLSAERLWLERLRQQVQTFPVWPRFTLEQCEMQAVELPNLWKEFLDEPRQDGSRLITYENTIGETWSNTVDDILTHVIMHSAYHRGQIATAMRAAGVTPAYTDFIHSVRQRSVE